MPRFMGQGKLRLELQCPSESVSRFLVLELLQQGNANIIRAIGLSLLVAFVGWF